MKNNIVRRTLRQLRADWYDLLIAGVSFVLQLALFRLFKRNEDISAVLIPMLRGWITVFWIMGASSGFGKQIKLLQTMPIRRNELADHMVFIGEKLIYLQLIGAFLAHVFCDKKDFGWAFSAELVSFAVMLGIYYLSVGGIAKFIVRPDSGTVITELALGKAVVPMFIIYGVVGVLCYIFAPLFYDIYDRGFIYASIIPAVLIWIVMVFFRKKIVARAERAMTL